MLWAYRCGTVGLNFLWSGVRPGFIRNPCKLRSTGTLALRYLLTRIRAVKPELCPAQGMKNYENMDYLHTIISGRGAVAAFFGLKMLTASWQAEVLVQNDIYARHLKYIANDDIDTLITESCMALASGLRNYAELETVFWASDAPYYSQGMVKEINQSAHLMLKNNDTCNKT